MPGIGTRPAGRQPTGRPVPGGDAASAIEREIARSKRASEALAEVAAVARASTFGDSQLPPEEFDIHSDAWVRTEYVPLDPMPQTRASDMPAPVAPASAGPVERRRRARPAREGAAQDAVDSEVTASTFGTTRRAGAQSRPDTRWDLSGFPSSTFGPSTLPPSAAKSAWPPGHDIASARRPVATPAAAGDMTRFTLAAFLGAVVALGAGGLAWNAGLLSTGAAPTAAGIVTAGTAAAAEAARLRSLQQATAEVQARAQGQAPAAADTPDPAALQAAAAVDPSPAAAATGVEATPSSQQEAVAAAVAAAQRALAAADRPRRAIPVRAAAQAPVPAHAAAASPVTAALPVARAARRAVQPAADSVAAAVANAQARADKFLSNKGAGASAASTDEGTPPQP